MNFNIFKYIFFLTVLFTFSSCSDFFETTIEVDPPEHNEQLVVHGFGSARTDILQVRVSKTTGILDDVNDYDLQVNNASITLIHNGISYPLMYQDITVNSNWTYNYILENGSIDFIIGEQYRLEVEADGFEKVTGICTVPEKVLPDNFEFNLNGPSTFDDDFAEVSMQLSDPSGRSDYYEFYLALQDQDLPLLFLDLYTESFDPVVEEAGFSLLLNDESFDGELKQLDLLVNRFSLNGQNPEDRLFVYWRTISEDHYRYSKSFEQHQEADGNPFASPVQVFSNMENGIGIFSIYNDQYLKVN